MYTKMRSAVIVHHSNCLQRMAKSSHSRRNKRTFKDEASSRIALQSTNAEANVLCYLT